MKSDILDTPDAKLVLDSLLSAEDIVLTTHQGPDGDGIGSEIAMQVVLQSLGKHVKIVNPGPCARRFQFIDRDSSILAWRPELADTVLKAGLVMLLDTSEFRRTGPLAHTLQSRTGPTLTIDHHPPNKHSINGIKARDFSSTGELVARILGRLDIELDADIAFPLYCAILFDTNQFRFARNDPEVFRTAGDLVASGADADKAGRLLFGMVTRDRLTLEGRVLEHASFDADGRLAWACVTPVEMAGLDIDADDVRTMVMVLSQTEGVDIAVLFKVFREGTVKVSIRSRGNIPVNDVAEALGGGGHPFAAGADVRGELDAVIAETLPLLEQKLS